VSAYEAANNGFGGFDGFGDEGYAPSGGGWFHDAPGAAGPVPGAADGAVPVNGIAYAAGLAGFAQPDPGYAPNQGYGYGASAGYDPAGSGNPHDNGAGYADPGFGGGNGYGTGYVPGSGAGNGYGTGTGTGYVPGPGAGSGAGTGHNGYAPNPGHNGYAPQMPAAPAAPAPPAVRALSPTNPTSSSALLPALAHPGPPRPAPASDALRLVAVTAGLGQPSTARILADRLAEAARARIGERGRPVLIEVLELRDLALDIAGAMVAGFPGAKLRAALDAVEGADGLIAVSPIYTASYSGLFKSFFDVLDKDALTGKPTLIAATGGTPRHSLALDHALRPMFAYLRAFIVPTAVFAASEDWASAGESSLNERIERAGSELGDLMAGTGAPPAGAGRRRDEFEDVVPFEQRMAALRSGI
jgi:FMN reductase